MTKVMMKLGITPNLLFGPTFPTSLQSRIGMGNTPPNPFSIGSPNQSSEGLPRSQPIGSASENIALNSNVVDSNFGSRTEKVLNDFLQNPLLKGEGNGLEKLVCSV